jgi:hypothetical protein
MRRGRWRLRRASGRSSLAVASWSGSFPFGLVRQLFEREVRRASRLLDGGARWCATLFDPGAPPQSQPTVMQGLWWLLDELADAAPLVLVVDDAHWTDEASRCFLELLVRRIDDIPASLLMVARPFPAALTSLRAAMLRITPAPLTVDGAATVITERLAASTAPEFAASHVVPRVSRSSNGSHTCQVNVPPWRSTSGVPDPPRY